MYLHPRTASNKKRSDVFAAAAAAAAADAAAAAVMSLMVAPNFFRHQEFSACIFTSIAQPNSIFHIISHATCTFHAESAKELWQATQARAPKRASCHVSASLPPTFPALSTVAMITVQDSAFEQQKKKIAKFDVDASRTDVRMSLPYLCMRYWFQLEMFLYLCRGAFKRYLYWGQLLLKRCQNIALPF